MSDERPDSEETTFQAVVDEWPSEEPAPPPAYDPDETLITRLTGGRELVEGPAD